ncbi:anthranilate phosphoribosyltransferase [Desulfobacula sp.]|uniref:anthranilate phosphoribosyltransferase n=1 Tax=Desulfobacula sp. TaxID=2593537 RepID=UPI0026197B02|nr:anthranilate phosphoribosyltransferase [Desulfobacula sp.]
MSQTKNRDFGTIITRLIQKENLSRNEARQAFVSVLNNSVTDMQQGAFLAALTAKGETKEEVAGSWEAIYDLDTTKVDLNLEIRPVDNSGTGMDTFKTFNISTAASIIAAAGGIPMARHGARAITSICGTVDMAEALGVDVECTAERVAKSIESVGIGLFNGMSPHIHPMALGRILSQIYFGSTLNIAASLANPALPSIGVRGVYSKEMIRPVADVMQEIGYTSAIVLHGSIDDSDKGMDEASVCGITHCAQILENEEIHPFTIDPKKLGIAVKNPGDLAPENDIKTESKRFAALLNNRENSARKDAALLNAGLIFLAAGKAKSLEDGIEQAARLLETGTAFETLEKWVNAQNTDPEKGLEKLHRLVQ